MHLPKLKTDKDKNRKNTAIDFCYSGINNSSKKNLSKKSNTYNKNKEKFIFTFEKAK